MHQYSLEISTVIVSDDAALCSQPLQLSCAVRVNASVHPSACLFIPLCVPMSVLLTVCLFLSVWLFWSKQSDSISPSTATVSLRNPDRIPLDPCDPRRPKGRNEREVCPALCSRASLLPSVSIPPVSLSLCLYGFCFSVCLSLSLSVFLHLSVYLCLSNAKQMLSAWPPTMKR